MIIPPDQWCADAQCEMMHRHDGKMPCTACYLQQQAEALARVREERHSLLILLDECRDVIQRLTTTQVKLHNISPTIASRIDDVIDKANEANKRAALDQEPTP